MHNDSDPSDPDFYEHHENASEPAHELDTHHDHSQHVDNFSTHEQMMPDHVESDHHDIVGTPYSDAQHWEQQTTDFSCAIEAQRGIIEALTGDHVTEAQLCTEAAERGWLTSDGGTSMEHTGSLLELHGVASHCEVNATLGDIVEELALGHKIVVGVNAEELWSSDHSLAGNNANHAIWVTGVDKSDPSDVKVIINDSGDPDGAGRVYHMDDFVDTWKESGYFYLATDHAPPGLSGVTPDFDQHDGLFPDMVNWLHEHLPDSQTLLTDVMILSSVMDVRSQFNHSKQGASENYRKSTTSNSSPEKGGRTSTSEKNSLEMQTNNRHKEEKEYNHTQPHSTTQRFYKDDIEIEKGDKDVDSATYSLAEKMRKKILSNRKKRMTMSSTDKHQSTTLRVRKPSEKQENNKSVSGSDTQVEDTTTNVFSILRRK